MVKNQFIVINLTNNYLSVNKKATFSAIVSVFICLFVCFLGFFKDFLFPKTKNYNRQQQQQCVFLYRYFSTIWLKIYRVPCLILSVSCKTKNRIHWAKHCQMDKRNPKLQQITENLFVIEMNIQQLLLLE